MAEVIAEYMSDRVGSSNARKVDAFETVIGVQRSGAASSTRAAVSFNFAIYHIQKSSRREQVLRFQHHLAEYAATRQQSSA